MKLKLEVDNGVPSGSKLCVGMYDCRFKGDDDCLLFDVPIAHEWLGEGRGFAGLRCEECLAAERAATEEAKPAGDSPALTAAKLRASVFTAAIDYAGKDKPARTSSTDDTFMLHYGSDEEGKRGVVVCFCADSADVSTREVWPLEYDIITNADPKEVMAKIHAFLGPEKRGPDYVALELARMSAEPQLTDWVSSLLRILSFAPVALCEAGHIVWYTAKAAPTTADFVALKKAATLLEGLKP